MRGSPFAGTGSLGRVRRMGESMWGDWLEGREGIRNRMDPRKKQDYRSIYRDGLLTDTMSFWFPRCLDEDHGGFFTALDRDGMLIDTDKGVWQQGRITWMLAELYNQVEPREEWLSWARRGAEFLDQHCVDLRDGRMWFHVTREGLPIRKRRYAFSESFAAIAYGELAQATGESHFATKAEQMFANFVDHQRDPKNTPQKFTDTRPMRSIATPIITIATAQELRDSIGLSDAAHRIDQSIEEIRRFHLKPDIECVMEQVSVEGELVSHFDGRTLNPGHALEGAWMIMWEGMQRDDETLIALGCQMLDWMWKRGWDDRYGGILYFVSVDHGDVQEYWHDMKFWWPHNEAIIATLLAHQLTGNEKYASWHAEVHQWAYEHFADPAHGEWFGYLDRTGRVTSNLKGNLWKGPFHLPRMQLFCSRILDV